MIRGILTSGAWLLLYQILGTGATFITTIYLTQTLSINVFGQYGALINYANYLALIFGFGLPLSYIYFRNHTEYKNSDLILSSIILYLFLFLVSVLVSKLFFSDISWINYFLFFICGLIIFNCLLSVHNQKENFRRYAFYRFLLPCFTLSGILLLSYIYQNNITVKALFSIHSIIISVLVILVAFELKIKNLWISKSKLVLVDKQYFTYGIKGVTSNVMATGLYTIDIVILSFLMADSDVAIYVVAGTLVKLAWFVSDSIGMVIFPKIVKSKTQDTTLIQVLSSYSFIINLIGLIIFYLIGEELINVVFGVEYLFAYWPTLYLLMGSHGITIYKLLGRYFAAHNNWTALYTSLFIALVLNVVLNIIFIPEYGIEGAAIASLIAYWVCGVSMVLFTTDKNLFGYIKGFR